MRRSGAIRALERAAKIYFWLVIVKFTFLFPPFRRFAASQLRRQTGVDRYIRLLEFVPYEFKSEFDERRGRGKQLYGTTLVGFQATDERFRFNGADFSEADLSRSRCVNVRFEYALFVDACLDDAYFEGCDFHNSNFRDASVRRVQFVRCTFDVASARDATFEGAQFIECEFKKARVGGGRFPGVEFSRCDMQGVDLTGSVLEGARFHNCDLRYAVFTGAQLGDSSFKYCKIFGVNLWGTTGEPAEAAGLETSSGGPGGLRIEVDGLHTAVFIDSLWRGNGVRELIDSFTSTLVLVLGRFSDDHKPTLNSLRDLLRGKGYAAVLFDTSVPRSRDSTETLQILSRLSRFVISDMTDPKATPHELQQFVPFAAIPTICVVRNGQSVGMVADNLKYPWVLPTRSYEDDHALLSDVGSLVAELEAAVLTFVQRRTER